ncbi:hypothetical protein [Bdellovibrio sp. BCCA]|uniref:hypothetical protein n=1 Tax=Bdellovibrio sp. BCCA TaxID=3136281 RepID=UPI0030F0D70C
MNKWDVRKINILAPLLLFLVGCSDTTPSVSILRSIDGFDFVTTNVVTASMHSVPLQANCSAFVGQVEMSFDGGATWLQPTAYDPSAKSKCENGAFTVTLSNTKSPWSGMSFTNGQVVSVKFRALPRIGSWIYRTVNVKYSPSTPISQEVLAGSQTQTGTGLILHGRVRSQDQHIANGGGFTLKGRITQ